MILFTQKKRVIILYTYKWEVLDLFFVKSEFKYKNNLNLKS